MDTWTGEGKLGREAEVGGRLRGARVVGRALRGHVTTGNRGGAGAQAGAVLRSPKLTPRESEPESEQMPGCTETSGIRGQGGGGEEEETSETLNPGKVQGLCRFPRGRRSSVALC